jgi:hypothetical protein
MRQGLCWVLATVVVTACNGSSTSPNADGSSLSDTIDAAVPRDGPSADGDGAADGDGVTPDGSVVAPACEPAPGGGTSTVAEPVLLPLAPKDSWHEGWLASPAVVDLDDDGSREIIAARSGRLLVWSAAGTSRWSKQLEGRIWASPVVGELSTQHAGLEVAVAARGEIHAWSATGTTLAGFPVTFRDEMRTIAAGDIDGDGRLELVAVTTRPLVDGNQRDIIIAVEGDGSVVTGFPPNTSGTSGCDDRCYVTGGFDQNLALGDVNGDGKDDILAPQDNAYISFHHGDGRAFDAAAIFSHPTKWPGIRFLHDYAEAQQGWAPDQQTANQAHFTNTAPAIADVDGDRTLELVVLGSVQDAAQTDRERGVALWLLREDGTRVTGWEAPFHASEYLAGLWDYPDTNVVAATNQVSVVELDPTRAGLEMIFAGFDGRIYAVGADKQQLWRYRYTADARVLTAGVAVADLSGDGRPEIVFASYSPDQDKSELFILDAGGSELHRLPLPERGAMAVPTIADLEGDGPLEILLGMKDTENQQRQLRIYSVPASAGNCLLWPTGRGNLLRNGFVPP